MTDKILNLIKDLDNYKHDKADILYRAIQDRLNISLYVYDDDLNSSLEYLKNRKADKLMRKLNK